jgi:hypothetical protein
METKEKKRSKTFAAQENTKKSKFALAWENPNIEPLIVKIVDMRAVLK